MAKSAPTWRHIEAALLALFEDYGLEVEEVHGDRFLAIRQGSAPSVEYNIETLARELEDRL